ncbi:MAG: hypothetical protein WC222_11650 [Parachlamydiales bacterium]|jgi:hypothetical protein
MSDFLNNFVPEKVSVITMPVGAYDVIVKQVKEVTDHDSNLSGAQKENYRFADVHDQLAVTFIRMDNLPGIITHRFNTRGWVRFDEMSAKQQKSYTKDEVKGYAISKKTGMRVEDPARTVQCSNILNQFLNKLSKNGTAIIDDLIATGHLDIGMLVGTNCTITVAEEVFDGKTRNKITKINRLSAQPVLKPTDGQEEY